MISFVQFWVTVVACIIFIIYHHYSCLSGFLLCSCMKRTINFYFSFFKMFSDFRLKRNAYLTRTKDRYPCRLLNDELPTTDWLRYNYFFRFIWFVEYCRLLVVLWSIHHLSHQMENWLRWSWIVSYYANSDINDICQLFGNTLCSSTQRRRNAKNSIKLCSFWRWISNCEGPRMTG